MLPAPLQVISHAFFCFITGDVERFQGNKSVVDSFKIIVRDGNFLLLGVT